MPLPTATTLKGAWDLKISSLSFHLRKHLIRGGCVSVSVPHTFLSLQMKPTFPTMGGGSSFHEVAWSCMSSSNSSSGKLRLSIAAGKRSA
jgi:hypothetical protein